MGSSTASTSITAIAADPGRDDGGVLCQLSDGRVFVTIAAEIGKYAEPGDETALAAFNRAWVRSPGLFAGPITPRLPQPGGSCVPRVGPAPGTGVELEAGFTGELRQRDRARLHRIIDKHWRAYFAAPPTPAQKDNLLDGLGLRVAEKLVRAAVDGGKIH